jgi:hypothetical protein
MRQEESGTTPPPGNAESIWPPAKAEADHCVQRSRA